MADAGVVRDANRLPWLEPYRAPARKKSNRRAGLTAALGAIGLAGIVTLLTRDMIPLPATEPEPSTRVVLPAPSEMQPQVVLPELASREEESPIVSTKADAPPRRFVRHRKRISAVPTRTAYRQVMKEQVVEEIAEPTLEISEAALAIASLALPPDPPMPAVNRAAKVVRGKTVQLGVYLTQRQAEAAWQSAIRDYTYLVTMPKSIEPISIRAKRYYRLQLGTPSKGHAKQLCSNLKSIGRSCTVA
jgi:sporulation related protein